MFSVKDLHWQDNFFFECESTFNWHGNNHLTYLTNEVKRLRTISIMSKKCHSVQFNYTYMDMCDHLQFKRFTNIVVLQVKVQNYDRYHMSHRSLIYQRPFSVVWMKCSWCILSILNAFHWFWVRCIYLRHCLYSFIR
jgi:hypothetical protein